MEFEWDPAKDAKNVAKHGISFVAAARVLESGPTFEFQSHHGGEPRWVAIGEHPDTLKIIAVVYAARDGRYRVISARRARDHEEAEYRKHVAHEPPEGRSSTRPRPRDER